MTSRDGDGRHSVLLSHRQVILVPRPQKLLQNPFVAVEGTTTVRVRVAQTLQRLGSKRTRSSPQAASGGYNSLILHDRSLLTTCRCEGWTVIPA